MKTLLLYSNYTDQMSYYDDWLDAFKHHPDFHVTCVNAFHCKDSEAYKQAFKQVSEVELIVLHHSMTADTLKYLMPFVPALKSRKGKLVSFVGNEVNLPTVGMAPKINILKELETDVIATQLLLEAGTWLYKDCVTSRIISLPHGLNPSKFKRSIDIENRKVDIGTRSARYGVYIGDNDRNNIIQYFHQKPHGLVVDFGFGKEEQKRFDRAGWGRFLNNCKSTLSTEAGSFYLERDDKTVSNIHRYLKRKSKKFVLPNDTIFRNIYRQVVPKFIRHGIVTLLKNQIIEGDSIDENTGFQEIYDKFFKSLEKPPVYTKAISSRHFDAIGTHTLHVMYPGRYNDILRPNEHYFELKRDHSNIEGLRVLLEDLKKIKEITSEAYSYVLNHHTHKHRIDRLKESL